jgi:ATP-dependent RNA helicase RhlE
LDKICKIGKVKPAVFPVPVCAAAITSLPCNTAGIACSSTRELAAQVSDSVATYGKHLPLKSTVVFGGVKINPQMQKLRSDY